MKELLLYFIMFVLIYLFYVIFVLSRKNVLKKFSEGKEAKYLKYRYGIKISDKNIKEIANIIFLSNSFILTITVYIIGLFDSMILQLLIGIVVLLVLILLIYHFIGIYYKSKQGGKNNV